MKCYHLQVLFVILFASALSAQNNWIEVKGGFLYDADVFYKTLPESPIATWSNNTYKGFNYLALGYTKFKDKRRSGIELDVFRFIINPPTELVMFNGNLIESADMNREKFQIQAAYFLGKSILQSDRFDLFIAAIGGMTYRNDYYRPTISTGFPISQNDFILSLGGKFQGKLNVTDNIGVVLGGKFMVLDFMQRIERTENPTLTLGMQRMQTFNFDLIRNDAVLQLGIAFGF